MFELILGSGIAYLLSHWFQQEKLHDLEVQKKRVELEALLPPKTANMSIAAAPKKAKPRSVLVREAEDLLAEELKFCKKLGDPVARQAAEASAYVRFRQRLMAIMEITP